MPDIVRQAIDPKHHMRSKPFAVWVGGPEDGAPKDIDTDTLRSGWILIRTFEHVGYQTALERDLAQYGTDKRKLHPVDHMYPIREVVDGMGYRGWRIYYNERTKH